jgi:hypothetical protein
VLQNTFGVTEYFWCYVVLLLLWSTFGVTEYLWCYRLLSVLHSTFGVTEYLWCYRVLLVLQSTFGVTEYLPVIVLIGPILRFSIFKVTILLTKTTNLLLLFYVFRN